MFFVYSQSPLKEVLASLLLSLKIAFFLLLHFLFKFILSFSCCLVLQFFNLQVLVLHPDPVSFILLSYFAFYHLDLLLHLVLQLLGLLVFLVLLSLPFLQHKPETFLAFVLFFFPLSPVLLTLLFELVSSFVPSKNTKDGFKVT